MEDQDDDAGAAFVMPQGMTMRYAIPAQDLRNAVTGYNLYRVDSPAERVDWFLPAPAMLCIGVRNGPVDGQIGNHRFLAMPQAFVIGPSSNALRMTTRGGTMMGIGIGAYGWARMGLPPANALHNRIVPAAALLGEEFVDRLERALQAMTDDDALKDVFDAHLPALLTQDDPNLEAIAALGQISVTDGIIRAGEVAERMDMAPTALLRLSQRYFGLTPKLLLRRARFLRSFMQMFVADAAGHTGTIDSSYHDMSHYLRDANTFLGTTPRRFMQTATPILKASIATRAAVLGTPTQALHDARRLESEPS